MRGRANAVLVTILVCAFIRFSDAQTSQPIPSGIYSSGSIECRNGVVASISRPASDVGVLIMKQGGNAVDAAVATAFALAVTYPAAGNLGGGGFMLIHPAPGMGEPVVFDYRETAPAAATLTMFNKDESQYARKSVGVPGTVRGMAIAHSRFGKLPWPKLIEPAISLARDGFSIDPFFAALINEVLVAAPDHTELQRVYKSPGGGGWKGGDRLIQSDLARTLQQIANGGADSFYTGSIAEAIVREMARGDGIVTAEDLANYKAIERKPLSTRYRGVYDIYVPPAPSSGGACLIEELNMLQTFELKPWGRWSPELMHVMAEAMRRASYDRARYLGDPAFVEIPSTLFSQKYGESLAKTISLNKATRSVDLAADIPITNISSDENTTHFSVVDKTGMAVANTYTLERIWGSRIVVKVHGFLLNNDMRAFNLFPGVTDTKGNIGTSPNTISPNKRPLSSQSPTIVAREGKVILVTGTPGSQAIPSTLLNILVSMLDYHMPLQMAVESPRFSNSWLPDQITFEAPERYAKTMDALRLLGHDIVRTGPLPQGDAHSVWISPSNVFLGVTDQRRNDRALPSGY